MTVPLAEQVLPKKVRDGIDRSITPHLAKKANGKGGCSRKSRDDRKSFFQLMVAQLWQLGYRVHRLESLRDKHVVALMEHWHAEGIAAGTLHTRLSWINTMTRFLGHAGVCQRITQYLPAEAVKRHTVAKESKAWKAKGVDPLEIIELAKQIDERFAVMLALQHSFGLRVKESIELTPCNMFIRGGRALQIHEGTKGGKPRVVDILTAEQARVAEWAREVAAEGRTKRLRWPDCTWKQAQNRFYNYARKRLGLTKKLLGVTCHGLRHGYGQWGYRVETGLPTPIEGGALGKIDRATHQQASATVSQWLGHGRLDVTTSYYGSYGHALRNTSVQMTFSPLTMSLPA